MSHRDTHPTDVPNCFACKLLSVQINTSAAGAAEVNERERRWHRDMPAYYRLRKNGLQPKGIDGCGDLETRASSRIEVELGALIEKKDMPRVQEGMAVAKEMGWTPTGA